MRHIDGWFDLASVTEGRRVVVLGLPWEGSVSGRAGAAEGPAAIRRWARTQQAIDESGRPVAGVRVEDRGDVEGGHPAMEAAAAAIWNGDREAFLLGLGGDHSVTQPLLRAACARWPDLGLLTLDAHPDLFPDYEGDTASHACTVARGWEAGIEPAATALVGLRSFARQERAGLARTGLVIDARSWLAAGTEATADRIVGTLAGRPVFLSLDIDVLDPAGAPGTGYPIPGGPSSRQLLDLLGALWPRLDLVGADVVEVAPALDRSEITAATAAHVILQMLGWIGAAGGRAVAAER